MDDGIGPGGVPDDGHVDPFTGHVYDADGNLMGMLNEDGNLYWPADWDEHGPVEDPDMPTTEVEPPESSKGSWLDRIQLTLDVAGLSPGLGIVPDAANTGISLLRGNWSDAGMNALAMIPILGQGTKGGQLLAKGASKVDEAAAVLKNASRSVINKIGDLTPAEKDILKGIWDGGHRSRLPLNTRQQLADYFSGVASKNPAGSAQAAFNQARADYLLGRGPNPGRSVNPFAERFGIPKFRGK